MYDDDYGSSEKPLLTPSAQQFANRVEDQNHRVKIFDTPKGLCMSCCYSLVFRAPKLKHSEWQIFCTNSNGPPMVMPDDVSFCNQYAKQGNQSLNDMKKTATLIEREDAKRVGFMPNDDADEES